MRGCLLFIFSTGQKSHYTLLLVLDLLLLDTLLFLMFLKDVSYVHEVSYAHQASILFDKKIQTKTIFLNISF